MDLLEELESKVVPGDGEIRMLLAESRGDCCFEELCVSAPDLVTGAHDKFIAAGARVIRTNSVGANAVRLAKYGFEHHVNEINWSAAQIAKDCARGKGVLVAGCVGPLGIGADEAKGRGIDREELFREQIGALLDGGVNLIFFEGFGSLDELLLALYVKQSLHHCPAICTVACGEDGGLSPGVTLAGAFDKLGEQGAELAGVHGSLGPQAMAQVLEGVPKGEWLAAYPDAGRLTVDEFAKEAIRLVKQGVRLIGGCGRAGAGHIEAVAKALKDVVDLDDI